MKKNRQQFLQIIVLTLLFSGTGFQSSGKSGKAIDPPNVVIILMDDMGFGDMECYGGFPYHTPNINRLANEGMRFTNFYVGQAVCSASRSALLTGCYPTRIGMSGALNDRSTIALNPAEETIAEVLKARGYKTGMAGKWHMGCRVPFLPLEQGFDEYLGLPYSNDMWPVDYDGKPLDSTNDRGKYPPLPLIEGDKTIRIIKNLDDQSQLTTIYTERAVDFIQRNKTRPFFLYLAHSMPHVPIAVSSKFKGKSGAGLYGDVMEEVDWSVGQVMKTLDENGLTKNTIVIFTSDNGPWLTFGNHAGNTGGLREGKATAWDGGLKVPCIMRWPEKIKAGSICNNLAATMDLMPTLVDICTAKLPSKKIDGVDILPLLLQEPNANPRNNFVYYYDENSLKAVREGQWKLMLPSTSRTYNRPGAIGADGYPGKYFTDTIALSLFDLRADPGEDRDVKEMHPEIVERLTKIADQYRKELGDALTNQKGSEVRPAAKAL